MDSQMLYSIQKWEYFIGKNQKPIKTLFSMFAM